MSKYYNHIQNLWDIIIWIINKHQDSTSDDFIVVDIVTCYMIPQSFISILNHKYLFSRWPCNVHRFVCFKYKYLFVCIIHVNHFHKIESYKYFIIGVEMKVCLLTERDFCEVENLYKNVLTSSINLSSLWHRYILKGLEQTTYIHTKVVN